MKGPEVRKVFQAELHQIGEELTQISELVTEAMQKATLAFEGADTELAQDVIAKYEQQMDKFQTVFAGKTVEEVKASLLNRDKIDSSRKTAPLKIPEGAIVIDSTNLSIEEVLDIVEKNARAAFGI